MSHTGSSPTPPTLPATLSQEELDRARLDLLRRRVATFGLVVGFALVLLGGIQWYVSTRLLHQTPSRPQKIGIIAGMLVGVVLAVMPRLRLPRKRYERASLNGLMRRTIWIVVMSVLSQMGGAELLAKGINVAMGRPENQGLGPFIVLTGFMAVVHFAATLVVPWRVREAVIPIAIWLGLNLLGSLMSSMDTWGGRAQATILILAAGAPGILIAFLRRGSMQEGLGLRVIGERYADVEREMNMARKLHERLFPAPITSGALRMNYAYEPMRQIGGDYLDVTRGADGSLLVVLIDVTGHGVTAALAVNRLHGELKRVVAEVRDSSPARVIAALNAYVHLTLADESVFATAAAARVWTDGRVVLCIAGHPPPLVRGADGRVTAIEPTAAMLGPLDAATFEAEEATVRLGAGDVLVLYTDGATECRDAKGHQLNQAGVERLAGAATSSATLADEVLEGVRKHRFGSAEDDVLVAGVWVVGE